MTTERVTGTVVIHYLLPIYKLASLKKYEKTSLCCTKTNTTTTIDPTDERTNADRLFRFISQMLKLQFISICKRHIMTYRVLIFVVVVFFSLVFFCHITYSKLCSFQICSDIVRFRTRPSIFFRLLPLSLLLFYIYFCSVFFFCVYFCSVWIHLLT